MTSNAKREFLFNANSAFDVVCYEVRSGRDINYFRVTTFMLWGAGTFQEDDSKICTTAVVISILREKSFEENI